MFVVCLIHWSCHVFVVSDSWVMSCVCCEFDSRVMSCVCCVFDSLVMSCVCHAFDS